MSSSQSNSRRREYDKEPQGQPPSKKHCNAKEGPIEDPDVVVRVGGNVYHECSTHLSEWSEYFAGAFRSGMKESNSKTFEFPHRRAEEWELISSIIDPSKDGKVTVMNYQIVLPWCDELLSQKGLAECDKIVASEVLMRLDLINNTSVPEQIDLAVSVLPTTLRYDLKSSKQKCFQFFENHITKNPLSFTMNHIKSFVSLIQENKECELKMWDHMRDFLPSTFPTDGNERDTMIKSAAFPMLLHSAIQMKKKVAQMTQVIAGYRGSPYADGDYEIKMLRRSLANDTLCGDMFPAGWKNDY